MPELNIYYNKIQNLMDWFNSPRSDTAEEKNYEVEDESVESRMKHRNTKKREKYRREGKQWRKFKKLKLCITSSPKGREDRVGKKQQLKKMAEKFFTSAEILKPQIEVIYSKPQA